MVEGRVYNLNDGVFNSLVIVQILHGVLDAKDMQADTVTYRQDYPRLLTGQQNSRQVLVQVCHNDLHKAWCVSSCRQVSSAIDNI